MCSAAAEYADQSASMHLWILRSYGEGRFTVKDSLWLTLAK